MKNLLDCWPHWLRLLYICHSFSLVLCKNWLIKVLKWLSIELPRADFFCHGLMYVVERFVLLLVFELPQIFVLFSLTASVLEFDDSEKQKTYKTVSFREVQDEINELQVLVLFICMLALIFVFSFYVMHDQINYRHKSNANHMCELLDFKIGYCHLLSC